MPSEGSDAPEDPGPTPDAPGVFYRCRECYTAHPVEEDIPKLPAPDSRRDVVCPECDRLRRHRKLDVTQVRAERLDVSCDLCGYETKIYGEHAHRFLLDDGWDCPGCPPEELPEDRRRGLFETFGWLSEADVDDLMAADMTLRNLRSLSTTDLASTLDWSRTKSARLLAEVGGMDDPEGPIGDLKLDKVALRRDLR